MESFEKILKHVLTALYEPFGFAVVLAVLFMFLFLYVKDKGWKTAVKNWWKSFRTSCVFRRTFLLAFYTAMICFRTLLNRNMWQNPLSSVMGNFGLINENGDLVTEPIENLMLFIPFTVLLLWAFKDKILGEKLSFPKTLWRSVEVTFLFSLTIEFAQLLLRIGTFQLSDLFYNTLGGLLGGLVYFAIYKFKRRKPDLKKRRDNENAQ